MSLVLDLTVGGGAQQPLEFALTRPLVAGDLAQLELGRGIQPPQLTKLRESHHQLARLLARGLRPVEVSAITGYSQSRISILKADPAFQELIAHYLEVEDSASADIAGQLFSLGADVLAELRDRLQDSPESFGNGALMELLTKLLDRTGFGPTAKIQSTHIHVTGEELAKLKQLAKETQIGYVTSKINEFPTDPEPPEGAGAALGEVIPLRAKGASAETSRGAGQGENL